MRAESIAEVVYEAYRVYCRVLGDYGHLDWTVAPPEVKQHWIDLARFYLDRPKATPEDAHQAHVDAQVAAGWTYGPDHDHWAKVSPLVVPYDRLMNRHKLAARLAYVIIRTLE